MEAEVGCFFFCLKTEGLGVVDHVLEEGGAVDAVAYVSLDAGEAMGGPGPVFRVAWVGVVICFCLKFSIDIENSEEKRSSRRGGSLLKREKHFGKF